MQGGAYWESDQYLCSFAVGHMFTLLEPQDIDPKYKSWQISLLPILPQRFELKPLPEHKQRLQILKDLLRRPDVTCVINACDAAREGELIFREIVEFFGSDKWVRRLWLQSMTTEAIRDGFAKGLRDGVDLDGLGAAAHCRAQSDWLIGMNATRAFSERLKAGGDRTPWSVGRVQTPTLALLVTRELEILGHDPRPFFKVTGRFECTTTDGTHRYEGTYFDAQFKADERFPELKDDRIFQKDRADSILGSLAGHAALASESREESLRHAPYLFSLTGLQKYMATRYKWSAKRTLEAAQRCYEQHKVLTYPRTSSQCLPSDYKPTVQGLITQLAGDPVYGSSAEFLLKNGRKNDKRTFDDGGVTDHFAIIPTGKARNLSGDDQKVYDAVVRRFLATFFPAAVYDKVKRTTKVGEHSFRTGPVETLVVPGWLEVYDREADDKDKKDLPALVPGQKKAEGVGVLHLGAAAKEEKTKPPPRISEAGLLSLMEYAGRHVESEELAKALMSAEGLGTAATRADIIQNLKYKKYVDETLRPTFKGIHLIEVLRRVKAERLTSPELTARLELELNEVEKAKRTRETFMTEVKRYTEEVVDAARQIDWITLYPNRGALGPCPKCREAEVFERPATYACARCEFQMAKDLYGRYLDRATAQRLLEAGELEEIDGFRSRVGKDVKAKLLVRDGRLLIQAAGEEASAPVQVPVVDAHGASARQGAAAGGVVAPCPVHSACSIIETRGAYVCESRLKAFQAGEQNPLGFMMPKVLCRREISRDEVKQYAETGATPEMKGFISKTGNAFAAKLVRTEQGGFNFAFSSDRPVPAAKKKFKPKPKRRPKAAEPT